MNTFMRGYLACAECHGKMLGNGGRSVGARVTFLACQAAGYVVTYNPYQRVWQAHAPFTLSTVLIYEGRSQRAAREMCIRHMKVHCTRTSRADPPTRNITRPVERFHDIGRSSYFSGAEK